MVMNIKNFDLTDYKSIRLRYGKIIARMFMTAWRNNEPDTFTKLNEDYKI